MQDANGEKDCASNQEAPKTLREAGKDMCEPSKEAAPTDKLSHYSALAFNMASAIL